MTEDFMNRNLYSVKFCALDLETTGINPAVHKIIETGMVSFTLNGIEKRYQFLCDPGIPITEENSSIHGITNNMVKGRPLFHTAAADIISFIGNSVPVGHNPGFDLRFLAQETCDAGKTFIPEHGAVDTVILARKAFPDAPNHKLETLCDYLDIKSAHHRALEDAEASMKVFMLVMKKLDPGRKWTMGDLVKYHGDLKTVPAVIRKRLNPDTFMGMIKGRRYRIVYHNAEGITTERDIIPAKFYTCDRKNYVSAFCFLRNTERVFDTSRIKSVVEIEQ